MGSYFQQQRNGYPPQYQQPYYPPQYQQQYQQQYMPYCRADALAPRENDEQIVQFNLLESLRLVEVSSTSFSFIASIVFLPAVIAAGRARPLDCLSYFLR